jgi:hypothetical protein
LRIKFVGGIGVGQVYSFERESGAFPNYGLAIFGKK